MRYWDPTGLDEKSPGLVDTADTFIDRVGFISDVNKLDGPGVVFDVIGVGIKTGKFVQDPSVMRGVAVGYDVTKAILTAKVPPLGLALQGLDLIGIGPGAVIDWGAEEEDAINARIEEKRQVAESYRKTAESYAQIARVHAEAAARLRAETREIETKTGKLGQKVKEQEDLIKLLDQRIERSNELLKKVKRRR